MSNAASSQTRTTSVADFLRKETVGGALLIIATIAALIWANSGAGNSYFELRDTKVGIDAIHLNLSVGHWAADGLLAIFFFIVGLELKKEFIAGDLRDLSRAVVPITAAVGGVIVPALIFTVVNLSAGPETLRGWAIPTATDIAFALAVLAVVSSHLPLALRTFLLTLAVVDDLIAIVIIAFFYTSDLAPLNLLIALLLLGVFAFLVQRFPDFFLRYRAAAWLILLPIGALVWYFVHASGVHATIAGVLLGLVVPVTQSARNRRAQQRDHTTTPDPATNDDVHGLAETLEYRLRPLSAGIAVPLFAFFSAGVAVGGWLGFQEALRDPVAIGIIAGLLIGKVVGVMGATWLVTRTKRATLDPAVKWVDIFGVSLLAGIGFTVSLLVAELSFGQGSAHDDHAKVAILTASVTAAVLASIVLSVRNRHYRRLTESTGEANSPARHREVTGDHSRPLP